MTVITQEEMQILSDIDLTGEYLVTIQQTEADRLRSQVIDILPYEYMSGEWKNYMFAFAPVDLIGIDHRYQPMERQLNSKKIRKHYRWELFGPLLLGRREDGTLWAIDGQTRLTYAREEGYEEVPAIVVPSEGWRWEAGLFNSQLDAVTRLNSFQKFSSALAAGDPYAEAIAAPFADYDCTLAKKSGVRKFGCFSAITMATANDVMEDVLDLLDRSRWIDQAGATHNIVVGGLATLLIKANNLNVIRLAKLLRSHDMEEFKSNEMNGTGKRGLNHWNGYALNVAAAYNFEVPAELKIDLSLFPQGK